MLELSSSKIMNGFSWDSVVPYIDRRTGLNLKTEKELAEYLISLKPYFQKEAMAKWKKLEIKRGLIGGDVTKPFFDVLLSFKEEIENLPQNNNGARRIQDIKDAGYTIASVPHAKGRLTSRILLPIPLHPEMGYETFTPQFKARVIRLLKERNAFEARVTNKKALIPDHKFSEVRWDDNTKGENPMDMTDEEIIQKFQLLDNQRNQQKREVCRKCFQDGIRGTIYGINYFYKGNEKWDENIPAKGKVAEKGCEGCPWYDIEKWRMMLNDEIKNENLNIKINASPSVKSKYYQLYLLSDFTLNGMGKYINASKMPYDYKLANMVDIADTNIPEKFYITAKGCAGILRRKYEHKAGMNHRLETVLNNCTQVVTEH